MSTATLSTEGADIFVLLEKMDREDRWKRAQQAHPAFTNGFDEYMEEVETSDRFASKWDYSDGADLYAREEACGLSSRNLG